MLTVFFLSLLLINGLGKRTSCKFIRTFEWVCGEILCTFVQYYYHIYSSHQATKARASRGRRGRDRMVVGFTTICGALPITTKVVSSNPAHGEVLLDTTLCDNFVSYLPQVSGFLRILQFPPPIKLTAMV